MLDTVAGVESVMLWKSPIFLGFWALAISNGTCPRGLQNGCGWGGEYLLVSSDELLVEASSG